MGGRTGSGSSGGRGVDASEHMGRAAGKVDNFYMHESCGQCTPCREGTGWMHRLCGKLARGEATREELRTLYDVANNIMGNTICALGDGAAMPMLGFLQKFRSEFEARVRPDDAPAPAKRPSALAHAH